MKDCVLILYGGKSVEHDISIITALQVAKNLPSSYDFQLCYISREGEWFLADNLSDVKIYQNFKKMAKKVRHVTVLQGQSVLFEVKGRRIRPLFHVRCVLNCCHGHVGEDGCLQGLLECSNIPQSSPDILQSSLCMDKVFFKDVCIAKKIATPEFLVFHEGQSREQFENLASKKLKFPLLVKPSNLGSSIGISFCKNEDELHDAMELALSFSRKIIAEKAVENLKEFNCACLLYRGKMVTSDVVEVTNKGEIFSFEDKYINQKSEKCEDVLNVSQRVKNLTKKVYREFDLTGIVRVDFLFDSVRKKLYVNEVNTIPGSLAFHLFKGVAFSELIEASVEEGIRESEQRNSKITTFESDALKIFENVSSTMKK